MIRGKIVVRGKIELLSPCLIGSGESESSDMDVLKDKDEMPYIPATSFAGILRHSIKSDSQETNQRLERFWGPSGDSEDIRQSSIVFHDLTPDGKPMISLRDGVKINSKTGVAETGAKFDYEVIERGGIFNFSFEVSLDGTDDEFKKSVVSTIINLIGEGRVRVGAKTNNGLGKIGLKEVKVVEFDFTKPSDVLSWFKFLQYKELKDPVELNYPPLKLKSHDFTIEASFVIKNSLIVRDYNLAPNQPDVVQISSKGDPIIPGASLKGAIRARAERITKCLEKGSKLIDELFGGVNTKEEGHQKGRLIVEETLVYEYPMETQIRIKIDRFTGGTMHGALAEIKPLFSNKDPQEFKIRITIRDFKKAEAGLLLLVLKDLWTGDLPMGGEKSIGRGVLKGRVAKVSWNSHTIEITDPNKLTSQEKEMLQEFVDALVAYS